MQIENTKITAGHVNGNRQVQAYFVTNKGGAMHRFFANEVSVQKLFALRVRIPTLRHKVLQCIKSSLKAQLNSESKRSGWVKDILDTALEVQVGLTLYTSSVLEVEIAKSLLQAITTSSGHIVHEGNSVHEIYAPHPITGTAWFKAPTEAEELLASFITAQYLPKVKPTWQAMSNEFVIATKMMAANFNSLAASSSSAKAVAARRSVALFSLVSSAWMNDKIPLETLVSSDTDLGAMQQHLDSAGKTTVALLRAKIVMHAAMKSIPLAPSKPTSKAAFKV